VYQGLSNVSVKENDEVKQGQTIAKSGTSNINKDLGNHLHFELYMKMVAVNPEEYYNKSINE
jgi:stage II sporulation protein Q